MKLVRFGAAGKEKPGIIDKNGKIVEAVSGYTAGDTTIERALRGLGVKF